MCRYTTHTKPSQLIGMELANLRICLPEQRDKEAHISRFESQARKMAFAAATTTSTCCVCKPVCVCVFSRPFYAINRLGMGKFFRVVFLLLASLPALARHMISGGGRFVSSC